MSRVFAVSVPACAALWLALSCAPAFAQITDWQKPEPFRGEVGGPAPAVEDEYELPQVSVAKDWQEFYVGAETRNRYFVARDSLSVGKDGSMRFVSRVVTAGGAENVSVEAIRCATGDRRLYAYLRDGKAWSPSKDTEWSPINAGNRLNAYRLTLYEEHFCWADHPVEPRQALQSLAGSFKPRTGNPLTGYR
jgi:hypothetical protein